jgi:hypothetical protein
MGLGGQRQAQAALTLLKSPGQNCRGGWVSHWGWYGWNQNIQRSAILRSSESVGIWYYMVTFSNREGVCTAQCELNL